VGGDLARRTQQNWARLQHPAYRVPKMFDSVDAPDWPGVWEGRTLLAAVLLARSTGRGASQATQIVEAMPRYLNSEGYFGKIIDPKALDEQQLGDSHGALIRALYEFHEWTGDPRAREMMDRLVEKIGIPLRNWWASYPIAPGIRGAGKGGVEGSLQWQVGPWLLSSDIGYQFTALDGLVQAWQLDRNAELRASIKAGIERFLEMDQLAVRAQAHGTLTTLRALLRLYALTGEAKLLSAVEERYRLYRTVAMTESYANYNFFNRPDTWTEPCAIIDSFLIATQLWRFTGEPDYLEDAHLIWYNGVGRGQRATGGFGCDSCAGVGDPFLSMKPPYEATFCCTMRGGEGHSFAIQSCYHTRPGELAVTFYNDSQADLDLGAGQVSLQQSTRYPDEGTVQLKVTGSTVSVPITVRLFAPSWMAAPQLTLNGRPLESRIENGFVVARLTPRAGDLLTFDGRLKNWVRPTRNPHSIRGYHAFFAGPLMLGHSGETEIFLPDTSELTAQAPGRFGVVGAGNVSLARINDLNDLPLPSWDPLDPIPADGEKRNGLAESILTEFPSARRQVLFRDA